MAGGRTLPGSGAKSVIFNAETHQEISSRKRKRKEGRVGRLASPIKWPHHSYYL